MAPNAKIHTLVLTGPFVSSRFEMPTADGLGNCAVAANRGSGEPYWQTALIFGDRTQLAADLAKVQDGTVVSIAVDLMKSGKTGNLFLAAVELLPVAV